MRAVPAVMTNSTLLLVQWTSDVYNWSQIPVGGNATLCVSLNVTVLPLRLLVILIQRGSTSNVGATSRKIVLEVDNDEVGLNGMSTVFELSLGQLAGSLLAQVAVLVSENAIIDGINISESFCSQPGESSF